MRKSLRNGFLILSLVRTGQSLLDDQTRISLKKIGSSCQTTEGTRTFSGVVVVSSCSRVIFFRSFAQKSTGQFFGFRDFLKRHFAMYLCTLTPASPQNPAYLPAKSKVQKLTSIARCRFKDRFLTKTWDSSINVAFSAYTRSNSAKLMYKSCSGKHQ